MQRGGNVAPIQDGVVKDQNWNLQKKRAQKREASHDEAEKKMKKNQEN